MIDVERFLRDYCEIYCGTAEVDVEVISVPTENHPGVGPDRLTGEAPVETRITVRIRDVVVEAEGIDLHEALTETMAQISAPSDRVSLPAEADHYTVSGDEVTEAEFVAAFPSRFRERAEDDVRGLYSSVALGMVGEFDVMLYTSADPDLPPLLYAYGSDGQDQYHLLPDDDGDETLVDPFTTAWARGMSLAGRGYFRHASHHEVGYRSLAPHVADIQKSLGELPASTAVFLAAMVSFFNGDTGGKMLRGLQSTGLGDIAARLNDDQRRVLADLLVSYRGW